MTSIDWNELFEYRDGQLINKTNRHYKTPKGSIAGADDGLGYIRIKHKGVAYKAHRIIWEMHNGPIPEGMFLDHINRVRSDNRIENLRLASREENNRNTTAKGYYFDRKAGRYKAHILNEGKREFLGYYDTEEQASKAYLKARAKYFGEFA